MRVLFEVFYQPGKLFESLEERKAAWVAPLIVDTLLVLAVTMATIHLIGMETIIRQRLEASHLSAEQMQTAMSRANSPIQYRVSFVAAAFVAPLTILVTSGCLFAFSLVSSRPPRFASMFAMAALAFLPYWLVSGLMTTLTLAAAPDRTALDVQNLLATNLGAFLDRGSTSKGLYSLATSLDALSLGEIFLLGFGFSKLTRSSLGFGILAVAGPWAVYVAIKMGMSLLF